MKLLFDENLSFKLVTKFSDIYPGSTHVNQFFKAPPSDRDIWNLAKDRDFVIISKDDDFQQLTYLYGAPPKVIWLRLGNVSTEHIESFLRDSAARINEFSEQTDEALLILEEPQK